MRARIQYIQIHPYTQIYTQIYNTAGYSTLLLLLRRILLQVLQPLPHLAEVARGDQTIRISYFSVHFAILDWSDTLELTAQLLILYVQVLVLREPGNLC